MDSLLLRQLLQHLRQGLEQEFVRYSWEWVELATTPAGALTLILVSSRFQGLSANRREELVQDNLAALSGHQLDLVWTTLLTPAEAEVMSLARSETGSDHVSSWLDFAYAAVNARNHPQDQEPPANKTRTVVFYSYKGGVGRTTAMLHVAYLLAKEGKRIVLVDMDLEAPGLQHAFEHLEPRPEKGLVDYLYERQLLLPDSSPSLAIRDILGKVGSSLPMKGDIYVVPAGKVDLNYIATVDDLDTRVGGSGPQAWDAFLHELTTELKPDLIFIDSRTGLNRWGAISLLVLADEAFVFAYPNRQNMEGLVPLLQALKGFGRPPLTMVFSAVPRNQSGESLVDEAWRTLAPLLPLPEDVSTTHDPAARGEAVVVWYDATIATSDYLPVSSESLHGPYRMLAARLGDITLEAQHISELAGSTLVADARRRRSLLQSIDLPTPFAEKDFDQHLFQPIEVLPAILRPEICLIRGRKGTGKSWLYRMFQTQQMRKVAGARMDGVWTVAAHGANLPGPTREDFERLAERFARSKRQDWTPFWVAYALIRLWMDETDSFFLANMLRSQASLAEIRSALAALPRSIQDRYGWGKEQWPVLTDMIGILEHTPSQALFAALREEEDARRRRPSSRSRSVWLLYDNLEQDLPQWLPFWNNALEGLFSFIALLDEWRITWLRPKVFLREDLWQRLRFANKTHFENHQVELRWEQIDLLRLAYRLFQRSGAMHDFLREHEKLRDPDYIAMDDLEDSLGLVWGLRRAPSGNAPLVHDWVYGRLIDAKQTAYPREMVHALSKAREFELRVLGKGLLPPDRLLSSEALEAGLLFASKKRCEAMRSDEYDWLAGFFAALRGAPARGDMALVHEAWQHTLSDSEPIFRGFVSLLVDAGLITTEGDSGSYRFADIYIDGFGLVREPEQGT